MSLFDKVQAGRAYGEFSGEEKIEVPNSSAFYEDILPEQGNFCLLLLPEGRHIWAESHEQLIALTGKYADRTGVYFGTAAFETVANRKQTNVLALRALRLDIDAGLDKLAKHGIDAVYATQKDALAAVVAFTNVTGLVPSYIVSSGEGLHLYFCLDENLTPAQWLPLAKALSTLCRQHKLKIDPSVTEDTARILRPLGSTHGNGKRVATLKRTGVVYSAAQLAALLPVEVALPVQTFDKSSINADVLGQKNLEENRNRDAGLIVKACPLMAEFAAGQPLSEPDWRCVVGVMKYCRDGLSLWHAGSAKDPRYNQNEAQRKWDNYQAGPTLCGKASQCAGCKYDAKLPTPILLGDVPPDAPLKPNLDNVKALQETLTAGGLQVVMDQDGQLNIVITSVTDGRSIRTVLNANSIAADDAILALAGAAGKPPSERAVEGLKAQARHAARQRGEAVPIYLRSAEIDGVVYVDLGPGRIARVDSSGVLLVDDQAPGVPLFRRGAGVGQLPNPELSATVPGALRFTLKVFIEQFGLTTEQALVTVVLLLDRHLTNTPHPVDENVGPAGSGKSTFAEFKISLIDPPGDGGRVTVGQSAADLIAAAQQRHVLPMDNVGKMDKTISDLLCIASTGGVVLQRQLYTNGETAILKFHKPISITAVSPQCTAPDLQSRVIRTELPARGGGFKSESEIRHCLAILRPKMLGAIYTLLSGALHELPAVRAKAGWSHRLVDFDQLGEAVIAAAGMKSGTFLTVINQVRERMARRTASGDLFLMAFLGVMRKLALKPTHTRQLSLNAVLQLSPQISVLAHGDNRIEITARPGALHKLLPLHMGGLGRDNAIPATERGLADAVRRVQPLLHSMGVDVMELTSGSRSLIRLDFNSGAIREE
jgi:hypothetical protein